MFLRVVDIETTGEKPPEAKVIELGCYDVVNGQLGDGFNELYNPGGEIPAETKAIHHITEADVASAPLIDDAILGRSLLAPVPDVLVAHNAEFERLFLGHLTGTIPWLCTYKAALWLWPDLPRHNCQALRYTFLPEIDRDRAMPPHRAMPDAFVTAELLRFMLTLTTVEQMIAWTAQPKHMPRITFGKYGPKDGNRGLLWSEIDGGYLDWMLKQKDMDADAVWHAREELKRRWASAGPTMTATMPDGRPVPA